MSYVKNGFVIFDLSPLFVHFRVYQLSICLYLFELLTTILFDTLICAEYLNVGRE